MTTFAATFALGQNVTVAFPGKKLYMGTIEHVTAKTVTVEWTRSATQIDSCRFVRRERLDAEGKIEAVYYYGAGAVLVA